jgi:oxygen-independent coproporphyrinogen-3 oxidase
MDDYNDAVLRHIQSGAETVRGRKVNTVFFGGGTPSLMGGKRIAKLLECIHKHYDLADDVEISLEANPESATPELFAQIVPLGVNRISMGAQSFSNRELEKIGRVHDAETIPKAVDNVKNAGIKNVSLDLIYGLPDQHFETWQESLQKAVDCGLSHLSAYALSFEEGTLLHRQLENGFVTTMHEDTYVDMYEYMQEFLAEHGLVQYEISNWCLPGQECRHNLIYWDRNDYLAFGVSAHGMIHGWKYHINPVPKQYMAYFEKQKNQLPMYLDMDIVLDKEQVSAKESAEDAMIFGLRKSVGIHIPSYEARYGINPFDRWGREIHSFLHLDWLELKGEHLRLTKSAYLISNEVMQAFVE